MAESSPIPDAASANLRATQELTRAVLSLKESLNAREAPTSQQYLTRERMATNTRLGGPLIDPTTDEPFISVAQTEAAEGTQGAGEPSQHRSEPELYEQVLAPREVPFRNRLSKMKEPGGTWQQKLNRGLNVTKLANAPQRQAPGEPSPSASMGETGAPGQEQFLPRSEATQLSESGQDMSGPGAVPGMTDNQAKAIERENMPIPQYGEFKLDNLLKMARNYAGQKAEVNPETGEPNTAGTIAGALNYASAMAPGVAAIHQLGKNYISQPISNVAHAGFASQQSGAEGGFSPQTGLGPSAILGFRNPLAAFTSEAGKQGIGQELTSAKAAFLGTGITASQAQGLRESLQGEGFTNQSSGFLGMTTGGQQENAALALEPAVKQGLASNVAGGFAAAARMGNASFKELGDTLVDLDKTARTLHQSLTQTGEAMQSFGAEATKSGASALHGMQAYGNIATATGYAPEITSQINQGQFGQAMAIAKGVLPHQIGGLSGTAQVENSYKTMEYLLGASKGYAKTKYGPHGEVIESAEDAQIGFIQEIEPNMNREAIAKFIHDKGKIPALEATKQLEQYKQTQQNFEAHQEQYDPKYAKAKKTMEEWRTKLASQGFTNKEIKEAEKLNATQLAKGTTVGASGGFLGWGEHGGHQIDPQTNEALLKAKEELAKGPSGKLKGGEEGALAAPYQQLKKAAEGAGVSKERLAEVEKEPISKRGLAIEELLQAKTEVKPGENSENSKIELTATARKFFEIKDPNALKEEAGAGGPSLAHNATKPNQKLNPQLEAHIAAMRNRVSSEVSNEQGRATE